MKQSPLRRPGSRRSPQSPSSPSRPPRRAPAEGESGARSALSRQQLKARRDATQAVVGEPVRLQKLLAQAGFGSRREVEGWISAGRLVLNGRLAQLGNRATTRDRIALDGKPLVFETGAKAVRVLVYHKPDGEVVSRHDPEGRPTVFANLPSLRGGKWTSIGRLDYNTSGVLLFTNSGELAHRLMHPRYGTEREYAVRVLGGLTKEEIAELKRGVKLDDGPAAFERISEAGGEGANRWYTVSLREGRNREVRRMIEAVGKQVSRLIRVRYGSVKLPANLKPGHWRELSAEEVGSLSAAGVLLFIPGH